MLNIDQNSGVAVVLNYKFNLDKVNGKFLFYLITICGLKFISCEFFCRKFGPKSYITFPNDTKFVKIYYRLSKISNDKLHDSNCQLSKQ